MPDREAVACSCDRLTWADLRRRARAIAGLLLEQGAAAGDIVPISLANGCALAAATLGSLAANTRPLLLAPGLTASERLALLQPWGVRIALVEPGAAQPWREAGSPGVPLEISANPPDLAESPTPSAMTLVGSSRPAIMPPPDSVPGELLIPTSGSTGTPKIVRLSEVGTVWNARAHMQSVGVTGDDRLLVVTPLHHAATLVAQFVGAVVSGASMIFADGPFSARLFWETVVEEGVTTVALTPTHAQMLLARPQAVPQDQRLALRRVTVGSAPIAPHTLQDFAALIDRACGAKVHVTYGLTEAGPRVSTLPASRLLDRGGSVGIPLEGVEVRVADLARPDCALPPGAEGELQIRSPSRMLGYLGEPPSDAEWLRTGDLATIDEEGFVTLQGRFKELIVSGGVNVSPVEVEHALCRDARVREAAVTGEPHPLLGEIVRAFVVPAGPVDEPTLLASLAAYLAPYKLPRKVDFLEALPRTATGKVDKRRLRELPEPS